VAVGAGWQWHRWIGCGSAVILVPNTVWQWLGGSGDRLIGSAVTVRSFWYQTQCGSGWVAVAVGALDRLWQCGHFDTKDGVAVAVAGWQWQWAHWIGSGSAVILVPDTAWLWLIVAGWQWRVAGWLWLDW
jgi:hypothetical protein